MTETQTLVAAYQRSRDAGVRAALATVVRVEGSAYRQPGARMLVTETGETTGAVSGGCLDGDVRARAARVMRTGRPVVVKYDTTSDDDFVWGLSSGCHGVVHVLIEPAGETTDLLMQLLDGWSTSRRRAAIATVVASESSDYPLAARMMLSPHGSTTTIPGAPAADRDLTESIARDLHRAVRDGVSAVTRHGVAPAVETFIEIVEPQLSLFIFGAGADVVPLINVACQLGWHTTVVDTHRRGRSLERCARADAVILCPPDQIGSRVVLTESSVAVLMTHNYRHDRDILCGLIGSPVRYIGCLGPRGRTEQLLADLSAEHGTAPMLAFDQLHGPAGLDIGAETAPEIALAIAAEIQAVLRNRPGGALRHRPGSIHGDQRRPEARLRAADAPLSGHVLCESIQA